MLRASGLTKRFGGFIAIDNADVAIVRGRITACVGPNGAGKSTLVSLLAGSIEADEGRIVLDDKDLTSRPAWERAGAGLRRTFQNAAGIGEFSVRQNLELGVWRRRPDDGSSGRNATLASPESIAEFLRLESCLDDRLNQLSLGVQRKVGIGVAMIGNPVYLLLDEPLAGTEASDRRMLLQAFRDLASLDLGLMWIEHDLASVRSAADALIVLDKGQVIAQGDADLVVADPIVQKAYWGSTETVARNAEH